MAGERPDCEERPVDGARVERAELAVRELVVEDLEEDAEARAREVSLVVLVERDGLRAQTRCSFASETVGSSSGTLMNNLISPAP